MRPLEGQLTLDLFFGFTEQWPEPGTCAHERRHILLGTKPKSECTYKDGIVWTNCRETGRCTWSYDLSRSRTTGGEEDSE